MCAHIVRPGISQFAKCFHRHSERFADETDFFKTRRESDEDTCFVSAVIKLAYRPRNFETPPKVICSAGRLVVKLRGSLFELSPAFFSVLQSRVVLIWRNVLHWKMRTENFCCTESCSTWTVFLFLKVRPAIFRFFTKEFRLMSLITHIPRAIPQKWMPSNNCF